MTPSVKYPQGEKEFNKWLIREYLKYGSVDEVYRVNNFSIPVSNANYHRILDRWGIIKAAGPNSKLNEVVNFLSRMVHEQIPMDKLYKKMPHTFQVSAVTMYRILSYIKEGVTRRMGTALIIHPKDDPDKVLTAKEVSYSRLGIENTIGISTIPMTFSRPSDLRENAILRVLQHEVFSDLAVDKKLPLGVIPKRPKPFMYLDIADVRVEVFDVPIPEKYCKGKLFSSYKLSGYKFVDIKNLGKDGSPAFRAGVSEALTGYKKYLSLKKRNLSFNPLQVKTSINYFLAENL